MQNSFQIFLMNSSLIGTSLSLDKEVKKEVHGDILVWALWGTLEFQTSKEKVHRQGLQDGWSVN